ncbi:MAG TPA: DUF4388 domain-containing protein [Kofleriaceae bacterium]|nr:DUF4388 domain-containing protein [Kofleriaceae bacterium]
MSSNFAVARSAPLIVVADGDAELRDRVHDFLSERGYRVESASDAESAAQLVVAQDAAVLIADRALRTPDGRDLLSLARERAPATPQIALSGEGAPPGTDPGVVRTLGKPLSLYELVDAVRLAQDCGDGFHGWMHRMSLIDVLQMYHHATQSLVLHIRGEVEGAIALKLGELIHAEHGDQVGMPALVALLTAKRGQLFTTALDHAQRTLVGPFDHVLLDGLRSLDERRGGNDEPPAFELDVVADDWPFEEHDEPDPLDEAALRAWLAEHAPGAGVWRVDPVAARVVRLDEAGAHPEIELASPPGALGWAYELAELGDPTWQRVELTNGPIAIAIVRVAGVVIAFARLISGEAMQRRFHVESARLQRWLTDHVAARAAGGGA